MLPFTTLARCKLVINSISKKYIYINIQDFKKKSSKLKFVTNELTVSVYNFDIYMSRVINIIFHIFFPSSPFTGSNDRSRVNYRKD